MLMLAFAWFLMGGVIGLIIGSAKKIGDGTGFWLGAIFGPLGWLILLFGKPKDEPTT